MNKKVLTVGMVIIIGLVSFFIFRSIFPIDVFIVKSVAMEPAIKNGSKVALSKDGSALKRGDIAIFKDPRNNSDYLVERVVGLPNESIEIKDDMLFVNGNVLTENYTQGPTRPATKIVLGSDEYYLLGDNRMKSADSRLFGAVKKDLIIGRALLGSK